MTLIAYAHRSPNPFFCKSNVRLEDGTTREIDTYDFCSGTFSRKLENLFLDSFVSQRVAVGAGKMEVFPSRSGTHCLLIPAAFLWMARKPEEEKN